MRTRAPNFCDTIQLTEKKNLYKIIKLKPVHKCPQPSHFSQTKLLSGWGLRMRRKGDEGLRMWKISDWCVGSWSQKVGSKPTCTPPHSSRVTGTVVSVNILGIFISFYFLASHLGFVFRELKGNFIFFASQLTMRPFKRNRPISLKLRESANFPETDWALWGGMLSRG